MRKSKWLFSLSLLTFIVVMLTACKEDEGKIKLKVGAASVPHAEMIEFLEEDLREENIEVETFIVSDGIQTNVQTAEGELDANFFQHVPYLTQVNEDSKINLVDVIDVHVEPFGVYSRKIDSFDDFPEKGQISIPEDPANFSRALELLADHDIIQLDSSKTSDFTLEDIVENEKEIEFIPVQAEMLVHSLDDVDASTINSNFALEGGFNPLEDAIFLEGSSSNYVNILVTREDKVDDESIQKLAQLLTSDKVKQFIEEKYDGAVIPVF